MKKFLACLFPFFILSTSYIPIQANDSIQEVDLTPEQAIELNQQKEVTAQDSLNGVIEIDGGKFYLNDANPNNILKSSFKAKDGLLQTTTL